ncbi:tetratricopeptide repeat protein [Anatilimnocola sp. NA78]|uniref:tetratricopeptide repeat protein n=1 Tax=Anatilimnocola sp. NA78 TaxID=3415683 RepID=UPI003CE4DB8E
MRLLPALLMFACVLGSNLARPSSLPAEDFKSFDDAMRAASKQLREKKYAEAQEPLEAAVKLAKNDEDKLKAYQALVPAYRLLPEVDKMLEAQEFVLRHAESRLTRSFAGRDLAVFLHQRGKSDWAIERYEAKLRDEPFDPAALGILTAIFMRQKKEDPSTPEFERRLKELDRKLATKLAEKLEKEAAAAPRTAAWSWKDAAAAWVEAGDNAKALAAARQSLAKGPEERTSILAFYWRQGLGNVFLKSGEPKEAITQFEAALGLATSDLQRKDIEKQLAELKAAKP